MHKKTQKTRLREILMVQARFEGFELAYEKKTDVSQIWR